MTQYDVESASGYVCQYYVIIYKIIVVCPCLEMEGRKKSTWPRLFGRHPEPWSRLGATKLVSQRALWLPLTTGSMCSFVDMPSEGKIKTYTYIYQSVVGDPDGIKRKEGPSLPWTWRRVWYRLLPEWDTYDRSCNNLQQHHRVFSLTEWLTGCIEPWYADDPLPAESLCIPSEHGERWKV